MKSVAAIPTTGLVRRSGNRIIIQQPGYMLDGYDLTEFYVSVVADDVTIMNCLFGAAGNFTVDQQSGSGLTVFGCEFDTKHAASKQMAFISGRDGTLTVRKCTFKGAGSDCILISRGIVEDNEFSDPWGRPGSHSAAVTVSKTTGPVAIRNNKFDWRALPGAPGGPNNCIRVSATAGAVVRDVTIEGNTLIGGTFSIQAGIDPTSNRNTRCERIAIRDNVVSGWGKNMDWLYPTKRATDLIIDGNRTPDDWPLHS
ncbi:hypothetical protein ASG25_13290 [Rhizobium sp. Leaf384]|nr:hypothetical protein ASG25_13290 [Rhizobium sp. Leaf384]